MRSKDHVTARKGPLSSSEPGGPVTRSECPFTRSEGPSVAQRSPLNIRRDPHALRGPFREPIHVLRGPRHALRVLLSRAQRALL